MQTRLLLALGVVMAPALPGTLQAQSRPRAETRTYRIGPSRAFVYSINDDANRAVIGITTTTGSARDTLGVLVTAVAPGGPAEKAGIEEGNRIASVNGVNLKLAPVDVGDWDMAGLMSRRLTRELGKARAGDDVELRVYSGGQTRAVKMKTVAYDSLYRSARMRMDPDERAAIGISLGTSGSKRDTLGLLVVGVSDDVPAAKAGLEEGNRIAAINNVDLRVSQADAGDDFVTQVKVERLNRELAKLKPGDEVELRIYSDGRTRTIKVKTVSMSDLGHDGFMFGGGMMLPRFAPMPPMEPMPPMPPMPAMPGMATRVRVSRIAM